MQETNAIWHSLCVLTTSNCEDFSFLSVSKEKIQEICLMTQMIIVGAYDGEGYVFWEKHEK
ncbi:MAG: hypothetical protein K2X69_13530 [Silvanigrellaceae bacterium]|nr:hypothetical protein [Silvanigrellaceae bacterium]